LTEYWNVEQELVEHVAKVSRLELTKEELERFTEQLKGILDAFKEMDEVDTDDVKPSFHPVEAKNIWREDQAEYWDWGPFDNSEHTEERYFKGPKVT
jgi:aspartyl-tRNA(Asn)/glutamyl-tRNA(Gln) amidotransferase subunit C